MCFLAEKFAEPPIIRQARQDNFQARTISWDKAMEANGVVLGVPDEEAVDEAVTDAEKLGKI